MITIDRSRPTPVYEQLVNQLRFLIASGHFDPRQNLPSTRSLAQTLSISFHTVRRSYRVLQDEGIVEAAPGSGFRIRDVAPLSRSDRIERGAAILSESLQQLVGLGLTESEIEYLVDEQIGLLETRASTLAVMFVSASKEIADLCAASLSSTLQRHVDARAIHDTGPRPHPDFVIAEFRDMGEVRRAFPRSETIGISTHIPPEALDAIARLLNSETLGLLTGDSESIRYLTERIKRDAGFGGQIVATRATDEGMDLRDFFRDADLLAYTTPVERRARAIQRSDLPSARVTIVPDPDSVTRIVESLPD